MAQQLLVTWYEVTRYREFIEIDAEFDPSKPVDEQDGDVGDAIWTGIAEARGRAKPLDVRDGDEGVEKVESL
jgi:hypothetical protein